MQTLYFQSNSNIRFSDTYFHGNYFIRKRTKIFGTDLVTEFNASNNLIKLKFLNFV